MLDIKAIHERCNEVEEKIRREMKANGLPTDKDPHLLRNELVTRRITVEKQQYDLHREKQSLEKQISILDSCISTGSTKESPRFFLYACKYFMETVKHVWQRGNFIMIQIPYMDSSSTVRVARLSFQIPTVECPTNFNKEPQHSLISSFSPSITQNHYNSLIANMDGWTAIKSWESMRKAVKSISDILDTTKAPNGESEKIQKEWIKSMMIPAVNEKVEYESHRLRGLIAAHKFGLNK